MSMLTSMIPLELMMDQHKVLFLTLFDMGGGGMLKRLGGGS